MHLSDNQFVVLYHSSLPNAPCVRPTPSTPYGLRCSPTNRVLGLIIHEYHAYHDTTLSLTCLFSLLTSQFSRSLIAWCTIRYPVASTYLTNSSNYARSLHLAQEHMTELNQLSPWTYLTRHPHTTSSRRVTAPGAIVGWSRGCSSATVPKYTPIA